MYQAHWGLSESPFRGSIDPRFYYNSPGHDEALARMQFLVDNQQRLGVLLGPAGVGKSLLFDVFSRQLRQQGRHALVVSLGGLDSDEFLRTVAAELGSDPEEHARTGRIWSLLTDRLVMNRYQNIDTVALLDDADECDADMLTVIGRLAQWQPFPESRFTVIVSARDHRRELLGRRLLELCDLKIELATWELHDTADYLKSTLAKVGRTSPTFDVQAMARIHELGAGNPRRIRQLAELSLLAGAGQGQTFVDESTVTAAYQELGLFADSIAP